MSKVTANTIRAISRHIKLHEKNFYMGEFNYDCNIDGTIRRRWQRPGHTPKSNWEIIAKWDPITGEIEAQELETL